MITMTRRFYKTHSAVQRPQIMGLYCEAIHDATKAIENGTQTEYYIVEVVAVVKREPVINPITVVEVLR